MGKNLDSGKTTDVVYLDLSKAFDSVSHPNLIQKLRDHGIYGPLLNSGFVTTLAQGNNVL
jgi:hypothetical protein